jgi:hypothetical protein
MISDRSGKPQCWTRTRFEGRIYSVYEKQYKHWHLAWPGPARLTGPASRGAQIRQRRLQADWVINRAISTGRIGISTVWYRSAAVLRLDPAGLANAKRVGSAATGPGVPKA